MMYWKDKTFLYIIHLAKATFLTRCAAHLLQMRRVPYTRWLNLSTIFITRGLL